MLSRLLTGSFSSAALFICTSCTAALNSSVCTVSITDGNPILTATDGNASTIASTPPLDSSAIVSMFAWSFNPAPISAIRLRASSDCSSVMPVDSCTICCKPSSTVSPRVRYANINEPLRTALPTTLSVISLFITKLVRRLFTPAPVIPPKFNLPMLGKFTNRSINAYGTPAVFAIAVAR